MCKSRILLVEGRRTVGGGQIMSRRICDVLSTNYDVAVFLPDGECPLAELLQDYSLHRYPMLEYHSGKKGVSDVCRFIYNMWRTCRVLRRFICKEDITVVYVQAPSLLPVVVCAVAGMDVQIFVHLHVVHVDRKVRLLLNVCLQQKCVKKIIGVSDFTLQQLSLKNRRKSVVLYNYIDDCIKKTVSSDACKKPVISVIADVMRIKGHHVLFEALQSSALNVEVLIIGRIIEVDYYKELIDKKYSFQYTFTGYVNDVERYLEQTDLVIVPSVGFETFSLAMVESWGKGIPTIASDLGGMKELVENFLPQYAEILLFSPGNIEELKVKIETILNHDILYREVSEKVHEVAYNNFSKTSFRKNLLGII